MPRTAAKKKAIPVDQPDSSRFIELADGCFRDTLTLHQDVDGSTYRLEFTPTLNWGQAIDHKAAVELAAKCALAGGGWRLPEVRELQALVDYSAFAPALPAQLRDRITADWHWSATVRAARAGASSPSGYAWLVGFSYGLVHCLDQSDSGFVVACRRVPAGQ